MNDIPSRDITGKCEGECHNRVKAGEIDRQLAINFSSVEEIDSYPDAEWAHERNAPPGLWGGHV